MTISDRGRTSCGMMEEKAASVAIRGPASVCLTATSRTSVATLQSRPPALGTSFRYRESTSTNQTRRLPIVIQRTDVPYEDGSERGERRILRKNDWNRMPSLERSTTAFDVARSVQVGALPPSSPTQTLS